MPFKEVKEIKDLKVGDVVRLMPSNYPNKPVVGGLNDWRQGFDVMTVYKKDENFISFVRPYIHVNSDGTLGACGIEHVDGVSCTGKMYYEIL